jgi:probable rRNA maturation factor
VKYMINVESSGPIPRIPPKLVIEAAQRAIPLQFGQDDLTIVLTDDQHLHELNLEYLGVDSPTDVLSFPSSERDPQTGARYLGDVLISVPRAEIQARSAGHPLESEVQLLVVHGVLHLLGYDHAEPGEKSAMWKLQTEILQALGLGEIQIREE